MEGFSPMSAASTNPTNQTNLTAADLSAFARLGISHELLADARVRRVTDAEARTDYGIRWDAHADLGGILFPYFIPPVDYRVGARDRRDHPEIIDGKTKNKYISAYGDSRHLYFPPGAKAKLADPDLPIVLVESEKAALALTAWSRRTGVDVIPLGMGGCWGWHSPRAKSREAPNGEREDVPGPISDLTYCNHRRVCVLLDNNTNNNPDVQHARSGLVAELEKKKRACTVLVCELPLVDGVNGPDDYLAVCGDEAMKAVFVAAHPPSQKPANAPAPKPTAPPLTAEEAASLTRALLDQCRAWILRFVVLGEAEATILAVWLLHTWAFDAAVTTPYIHVRSPEKESGKTTLLKVLKALARAPRFSSTISASALGRVVAKDRPTLFLDELDAQMKGDRERAQDIRGVLDGGFETTGTYTRCVGKNFDVVDFPTFSPKVLAGIGELWDTVESRAIPIEMRRRLPSEVVESFRQRRIGKDAAPIAQALEGWMNGGVVSLLEPIVVADVPGLGDRHMDISEPLLQIAQLAGDEWNKRLVAALQSVFKVSRTGDGSIGTMLLQDIRMIFKEQKIERIFSRDLSTALCALEGQPWQDWAKGEGLTPNRLANLLRRFHVGPGTIDIGEKSAKGYEAKQFIDAFSRYTPVENVGTSEHAPALGETLFSKRRTVEAPTFQKVNEPHASIEVRRSDVSKAGGPEKGLFEAPNDAGPRAPNTGANGKVKKASGDDQAERATGFNPAELETKEEEPAQAPAEEGKVWL
jgi:Protein of unknown function (DUF3631)/Domain of unknown function (DUF3854)